MLQTLGLRQEKLLKMKTAKLDLKVLRAAGAAATERINQLPIWQQEAIKVVSAAASSEQTLKALADYERHESK